jgi:hypothetical protein
MAKRLTKKEIQAETERQQKALEPTTLNISFEWKEICGGSPVPAGWIKVNDRWDPTICGRPTGIFNNVWAIQRYDNQPVGTFMTVCAQAPTPSGWVVVATRWDPTSCGHPSWIYQNMKQIKRVR